ncbi:L-2-amino-thiazoline-4-carboxylic acid hydrolase [Desulfitobacterium chlororespirans]|nr:L-2-amino-thiazoline-4-carboxylic acid hydrolase [Desulfitobacterium chlororespirans]
MISRFIFHMGLWASKKRLQQEYGKEFYKDFVRMAGKNFNYVLPLTPDIGESTFKFNFAFTPCYIAWYKAFLSLMMDNKTAVTWIWNINEEMMLLIPRFLLKHYGAKVYLGGFRKKAPAHEINSDQNKLHAYDYKIRYRAIDEHTFEIDFYQCGMKRLCEEQGAAGLFPGVCRIDYLISHYIGCGFCRTKTLGDGDEVCNCRYSTHGHCSWPLEEGLTEKK